MHQDVAARLFLLFCVVSLCSSARVLLADDSFGDVVFAGSHKQATLCGLCGGDTICGVVTPNFYVKSSNNSGCSQTVALIPEGTCLVCHSSGHCVPPGLPQLYANGVKQFCQNVQAGDPTGAPATATASLNASQFANTVEQTSTCTPCCDGQHTCGSGLLCYQTVDSSSFGYCAPSNLPASRFPTFCEPIATLSSKVFTCDAQSQQASGSQTAAAPAAAPAGATTQPSNAVNYNLWMNNLAVPQDAVGPAAGPMAPGPLAGMMYEDIVSRDSSSTTQPGGNS